MQEAPVKPLRRGVQKNISLDADAAALFPVLCENSRAYGKFISELLRQEMVRRETRQQMIREFQEMAGR
jgi:hypothetical protein